MNKNNYEEFGELVEDNASGIAETEREVLAIILNKGKDGEEAFLQLNTSDFFDFRTRVIFTALQRFRDEGQEIDLFSLKDYFDNNKEFQFEDYTNYIFGLNEKFTYQQNVKQLIEIIKNNSIKRQLEEFGKQLQDTDLDLLSSKEKLWNLEKDFLDITNNKKSQEAESISKILEEFRKKIDQLINLEETLTGVSSGYISIDKLTSGFQAGDLIILAARPGVGKTTLAVNFLVNAAKELRDKNLEKEKNQKDKVALMFSMEMGKVQICQKIVAIESDVELGNNKKLVLSDHQKMSIENAFSSLNTLPLYIDDTSDLTIMDVQSKIKQLSSSKEIKLVVLDYLQLLKGTKSNSSMNRQQEVSFISRTLKSIARQYNLPIIAIAQLSRKIEERKGDAKKPILSDLRESGAIEQDADLVCFISPQEGNDVNGVPTGENTLGAPNIMVEFTIAKNRNGATGIAGLYFIKPIGKYYDGTQVIRRE